MDNRDRDKMSKNTGSTPAGDVNRETSSRKGQSSSDSDASFGQNIGRSEKWEEEPSGRSGSSSSESNSYGESSSSNSRIGTGTGRGTSSSNSEH